MSELALQKIAECKRTRSKSLNLARCGLTDWPKELFECVWLEELILSNRIYDYTENKWKMLAEAGPFNLLYHIPTEILKLKNLKKLIVGGSGIIYAQEVLFKYLGIIGKFQIFRPSFV